MTKRKLRFPALERAAKLIAKSRKELDELIALDRKRDRLATRLAKLEARARRKGRS